MTPEAPVSSLWTNLLYLHGYLTDPKLARQLVDKPEEPPREDAKAAQPMPASKARRTTWFARLCLGIGDGALHWQ